MDAGLSPEFTYSLIPAFVQSLHSSVSDSNSDHRSLNMGVLMANGHEGQPDADSVPAR